MGVLEVKHKTDGHTFILKLDTEILPPLSIDHIQPMLNDIEEEGGFAKVLSEKEGKLYAEYLAFARAIIAMKGGMSESCHDWLGGFAGGLETWNWALGGSYHNIMLPKLSREELAAVIMDVMGDIGPPGYDGAMEMARRQPGREGWVKSHESFLAGHGMNASKGWRIAVVIVCIAMCKLNETK